MKIHRLIIPRNRQLQYESNENIMQNRIRNKRKVLVEGIIKAGYTWKFKDDNPGNYLRKNKEGDVKLSDLAKDMGKTGTTLAGQINHNQGIPAVLVQEIIKFLKDKHNVEVKI